MPLTQGNMSGALVGLYERQLLARSLPRLCYAGFGAQAQFKGYNTYHLRRYEALPPVTTPLTEGVTPDEGAAPTITTISITPPWYGSYLVITDRLLVSSYDPQLGITAELLGDQAALTVDNVTRAPLLAGATADFAGPATDLAGIDAVNDKITFADFIFQVAALDAESARPVEGGDYVFIAHPFTWATLERPALAS